MKYLKGFGQFWYDFVIGDDWKLAALVAVVASIGAVLVASGAASAAFAVLLGLGLAATFSLAMVVDVRMADKER